VPSAIAAPPSVGDTSARTTPNTHLDLPDGILLLEEKTAEAKTKKAAKVRDIKKKTQKKVDLEYAASLDAHRAQLPSSQPPPRTPTNQPVKTYARKSNSQPVQQRPAIPPTPALTPRPRPTVRDDPPEVEEGSESFRQEEEQPEEEAGQESDEEEGQEFDAEETDNDEIVDDEGRVWRKVDHSVTFTSPSLSKVCLLMFFRTAKLPAA
jgi:hypothetical protein